MTFVCRLWLEEVSLPQGYEDKNQDTYGTVLRKDSFTQVALKVFGLS